MSPTGRSASSRAFTPVFDGLWTRVDSLTSCKSIFIRNHALTKRMGCRVSLGNDPSKIQARAKGFSGSAAHRAACPRPGDAHRPIRRHVRPTARGAPRRLSAGDEAARSRPRVVAGNARQSAQRHARASSPRAADRRRWRATPASTSAASRRKSAQHIPTRPSPICAATAPVSASSGSWARTICAASTAGNDGAASPPWCRSRSSID